MSLQQIEQAYARRDLQDPRYHPLAPAQFQAVQARERALAQLLRQHGWQDTQALRAAELGCGSGTNLLTLLQLGFRPQQLTGVELLPERYELARERLPQALSLHLGDARQATVPPGSQDLVLAFTVFSSVLDDDLQAELAACAWRWLRPGGAVLVYDFAFDNPRNPDVRGVPLRRVRALFPQGALDMRRVTLAPPVARRLPAWALPWFDALPWLRTHRLIHIRKPL
ncbi:class I SAM-dependent methyltransferase [Inhella proteolytica]|uniref:Class I SAM-dependent methyltransferase n=1 Tax=Inhella proteolytica TaxID=2795029 RepID=A0A931J1W6_9BURK|nr:class I SAM-dependent methyltransferase [Inhella proteolytica]MBH9578034.1 class I SAM-dependent methyltransferase [Inhella proteolytica]